MTRDCNCPRERLKTNSHYRHCPKYQDPVNGPLTDRQTDILDAFADGLRGMQIATRLGVSVPLVRREVMHITAKLKADTFTQATRIYATAQAYRNAAAQVRGGRIWSPVGETEEHVNHVLNGIADLFDDWAAQRLPK